MRNCWCCTKYRTPLGVHGENNWHFCSKGFNHLWIVPLFNKKRARFLIGDPISSTINREDIRPPPHGYTPTGTEQQKLPPKWQFAFHTMKNRHNALVLCAKCGSQIERSTWEDDTRKFTCHECKKERKRQSAMKKVTPPTDHSIFWESVKSRVAASKSTKSGAHS